MSMENKQLFNENATIYDIEFDIVSSIISELIKDNPDVEITTKFIKDKLREEGYYITQRQVSYFMDKHYSDFGLNFQMSNDYPIHRIYYYISNNSTVKSDKYSESSCNNITDTTDTDNVYICKYDGKEAVVYASSYGKAKYKFRKEIFRFCPILTIYDVDYTKIYCRKFKEDELEKFSDFLITDEDGPRDVFYHINNVKMY